MNIHWCRSEAERLWWLHRENAMWWDELRASLLITVSLLRSNLKKKDVKSKEFKKDINCLKKAILIWKDVNDAHKWENYDGVDMEKIRVLQQIEWLKIKKD